VLNLAVAGRGVWAEGRLGPRWSLTETVRRAPQRRPILAGSIQTTGARRQGHSITGGGVGKSYAFGQ
jgi:hypothetical protein